MSNILLDSNLVTEWLGLSDLADRSKQTYQRGLKRLGAYLELRGFEGELDFNKFYFSMFSETFKPIDRKFIDEFIAYEVSVGTKDSELRTAVNAMKNFFGFLLKIKHINFDPMRGYPNTFFRPSLRNRRLGMDEVQALMNTSLKLTEQTGECYFLLVLLLITCGLRASEVCELTWMQVDFERHTILANRGQKTSAKTVYMSTDLEGRLKDRFENYKTADRVLSYKDKPLTYNRLRRMIDDIVSSNEDIEAHVTVHVFRYTMAALLLDFGVNVLVIQRQMRHERLSTTLHYLGVDAHMSRSYIEQNLRTLLPGLPGMLEQLAFETDG